MLLDTPLAGESETGGNAVLVDGGGGVGVFSCLAIVGELIVSRSLQSSSE